MIEVSINNLTSIMKNEANGQQVNSQKQKRPKSFGRSVDVPEGWATKRKDHANGQQDSTEEGP